MANEDRITGFEYVGNEPLTEAQYQSSFVNFYRQYLGLPTLEEQTGIETTDPEKITELRQPSTGRSEDGGRDTSMDIGRFGFKGPEVNTDFKGFSTPFKSYEDALNAAGLQDRVPFVENIVDPIVKGNISDIQFGKQVGVSATQGAQDVADETKGIFGIESFAEAKKKVSEKVPTAMAGTLSMLNPLMGATIGGVLTGKTFVNAFGMPSMRPGGILGGIADFVASKQYSDMAAIDIANATGAAQTGFAGMFGSLGITRAPGSGTYTGNMQGMSHTQVKNIEAISKGFVPSTYNMTEETGTSLQEGGYNTGRLATGGYYKENGTYMDPFGRTSAMGLMEDLESLASSYGVSVSQASNALSNARQGNGTLSENLASSAKDSPRPTDAGEEAPSQPQPSGDGGRGDNNFQGGGSGRGRQDGPGTAANAGGSEYGGDPRGEAGFSGGFFANGGRVGLAMGGTPQMASGFVDRPPSQVSDGQSVADDVGTKLPEGAFVINAAAVEFAGESDIKKMLTDANKEAVRRGLTLDKQGNDAKLIDVAISRGEVVVSPHLAKIIGYDRLNKINNRGKPETQERIEENGQQQQGAAEGGFIEPPEDLLNYEDRIIADEVKKKMSDLLDEAEKNYINVESPYHSSIKDPELRASKIAEDLERAEKIGGLPIGGAWQARPFEGEVDAPQTPTLFNLFALAEELAHSNIADNVILQEQERMAREDRLSDTGDYRNIDDSPDYMKFRYEEEMRAKDIAFDVVGGLLPKGKATADFTVDSYANSYVAYLYNNVESGKLSKDVMQEIIKKDSRVGKAWNRATEKYPQLNEYFE